ncbi:relaxase/mobilization nuclease domain-containing protein [Agriterribacter sp.]|uniref:relaxase/mobilization nuclease domain-containing protein n=1 Tax=Agriterribacter sp. TaxID=2821509 RepID=UPI002BCEB68E|nr:relaxase/mobilization nuclease domain-containing protein [Agriterribacter sp.]HTN07593.1 relaxase/mobilization nuclease domain-containing protein [Agriterribacter sp.]
MVAVIHSSNSIRSALNYNEQKVQQKQAKYLAVSGYPKDLKDLTFSQKLYRLTHLASLNQRAKVNSVHISLNFDPGEKLPETTLEKIANVYMEKIGFGKQPYLVYQHFDAGHPHLHVVTTSIQADGKRIDMHNLGRTKSQQARVQIEKDFGLIAAGSRKLKEAYQLKPVSAERIKYGKSDTRRAITNVLDAVLNNYKFSSLPELNAVLKLYNVIADRGSEDSRTFQKKGLVYRVLNERGDKVGVPIKASLIYSKPTLKFLETRFDLNEPLKQKHKQHTKTTIDWALERLTNPTLDSLIKALEKDRINVVVRQNKDGIIYGITYVDHTTKCVFNGSDLGKSYSAKGILERCKAIPAKISTLKANILQQPQITTEQKNIGVQQAWNSSAIAVKKTVNDPEEIMPPVSSTNYTPYQLKRNKKKRKKKRLRF